MQHDPRAPRPAAASQNPGTLNTGGANPSTQPGHAGPATPSLPEQFGRYRIVRKLGQGGMGSVYLAEDTQLDRSVALKVAHFAPAETSTVLQRFLREAKAAATLQHPHLCRVYDVGQEGGVHYLTMEYIEGKPLSVYIKGGKALAPAQIATLIRKLAKGLQEAHDRGVVHRDLKPSNIMINRQGEPVVMDFGLARRSGAEEARLTQQGAILGTPAYMSPEQVNGDLDEIGPASDIYSLGVVLYELLAGRLPFEGNNVAAILVQILSTPPPQPSTFRFVDPRLEEICARAMAKQPHRRYRSMREFAQALGQFLRDTGSAQSTHDGSLPTAPEKADKPNQTQPPTLPDPLPLEVPPALPQVSTTRSPKSVPSRMVPVTRSASPTRRRALIVGGAVAGSVGVIGLLLLLLFGGKPKSGTLELEVGPEGLDQLQVLVDGQDVEVEGRTASLPLPPGEHQVTIRARDHEPAVRTVTVVKGEPLPLQIQLTPIPALLALDLDGVPDGAEVRVDGKTVHPAQWIRPLSLPTGKHSVVVTAANHEEFRRDVTLRAGTNDPVPVRLVATTALLKVELDTDVEELKVLVDDKPVERSALARGLPLPAGPHKVQVSGPLVLTEERTVTAQAGAGQPVKLRLKRSLPPAFRYLPDDCHAVFGLDVRRFVKTPLFDKHLKAKWDGALKTDVLTRIGLSAVGLDPLQDIHALTMAFFSLETGATRGVTVVEIDDPVRIEVLLKRTMKPVKVDDGEGGEITLYENIPPGQPDQACLYLVLDKAMAWGTHTIDLKHVWQRSRARSPRDLSDRQLHEALRRVDHRHTFWMAIGGELPMDKGTFAQESGGCEALVCSVDLRDDPRRGLLELIGKDEEGARKLRDDVLETLIATVRDVGLKDPPPKSTKELSSLLNGIKGRLEGNRARFTAEMTATLLDTVIDDGLLTPYTEEFTRAFIQGVKSTQDPTTTAALAFHAQFAAAVKKHNAGLTDYTTAQKEAKGLAAEARMNNAGTRLLGVIDSIEKDMKDWKAPDSDVARNLRTAFQKSLDLWKNFVKKDVPETFRIGKGPGTEQEKTRKINDIFDRAAAEETKVNKAVSDAETEFFKFYKIVPK